MFLIISRYMYVLNVETRAEQSMYGNREVKTMHQRARKPEMGPCEMYFRFRSILHIL